MPKASPLQSNFNGGEFSPLLFGRVEAERYATGLATCLNYIPTIQGGLARRPATRWVSEVKDSSAVTHLIPFEFSITQAYMIEFGNLYNRFIRNNATITLPDQDITGATQADPVVITAASHGFSNGDRIVLIGVGGMVELNNREFIVANEDTNTFELQTVGAVDIDGTGFTAYTSGGTASEVFETVSPYLTADIPTIKYVQSADILYLVHPGYRPRKLTRTDHTAWTLTAIDFLDGPYLDTNTTTTSLTPSAATGTVTITASAVTGINGGDGFLVTDIGRSIRLKQGSVWGWVEITGRTSTTVVTVLVKETLTNTDAKTDWRLGIWSDTTGYPSTVTFHEDRLVFAGAAEKPQGFDGSRTGDYENFAPTDLDGTITDSHAIAFSLRARGVDFIRWISSEEKGLIAGTVANEWSIRPSLQGEAISPTNINAKQTTSWGSKNIQPVQADKATMFVQNSGRQLREMTFFEDITGFRAPDLSEIAEHITATGITRLGYQKTPQSIIWAVRADGELLGMTYKRDTNSLRAGWHRHQMGGQSDASGTKSITESLAVIPSADGERDDVYVVVKREINGVTKRYIEFITKFFEDTDEQRDMFFVDSGLTLDNPKTITGATKTNPVVITSAAHGFSNDDEILIDNVKGMTQLNSDSFKVVNKTANTFELQTLAGVDIDGTGFGNYVTGGTAREFFTRISGLTHLEGETVSVCADGAARPDLVVSNGAINLAAKAATVHVGLGYNSDGKMLTLEAGSADGTALGKTRRIHRAGFQLHRSLGLQIGTDFGNLSPLIFRSASDKLSRAPPLFSGIKSETLDSDYNFDNRLCWRQSQPLASTILSVSPQMVTQDRG